MNFNQLTIIGFVGKDAETKQLANGTPVIKFSVATTRSWKDEKGEWKEKTQWHKVVLFGQGFAQLTPRLVKGAHVFVQGELTTREYDRTTTSGTMNLCTKRTKELTSPTPRPVVGLNPDSIALM